MCGGGGKGEIETGKYIYLLLTATHLKLSSKNICLKNLFIYFTGGQKTGYNKISSFEMPGLAYLNPMNVLLSSYFSL